MRIKRITCLTILILLVVCSSLSAKTYEGPPPENFNEAPMLREQVVEGDLPPVKERLPVAEDLYVVEPNQEIGRYGGTFRTVGIKLWGGDTQILLSSPMLLKPTSDGTGLVPHVAKSLDIEDDKIYTVHLRKGMKWSDGHPFTTDDIMFWYNSIFLNEDLTPAIGDSWKINGKVMTMQQIDKYTVKIEFDQPNPTFLGAFYMDTSYWSLIAPKHYLKQFHPDYVAQDKLDEMIEKAGFDNWYELFQDKYDNHHGLTSNPDMPTISAFRPVKWTSTVHVYERNPYYWKVDKEGNQLPYVDKLEYTRLSDKELIAGKVMSGEVDFAGFNNEVQNYPMYKQYEEKGGYNTILWQTGYGNQCTYQFNLTHEDPVLRKIFQDVRFRRAMSLSINRDEINKTIYFGKAEPAQYTLLPSSRYMEPEFARAYADYDPVQARDLLTEMGLKDTDGDGWRERPDGKKLTFTIEYFPTETPKTPNIELVVQYWQAVGIDVRSKQVSGELQRKRAPANAMDATVWHGGSAIDLRFPIDPRYIVPTWPGWERIVFGSWSRWFQTDGAKGEEPPADIQKLRDWWQELKGAIDKERQIELGKKILAEQADKVWTIGTVRLAPWPVIVNKKIRNVPQEGLWCWSTLWTMSRDPEQFFYAEDGE